jgi:hypothetical protein
MSTVALDKPDAEKLYSLTHGNSDDHAVGEAARAYIGKMDKVDVRNAFYDAALNAAYDNNGKAVWMLKSVLNSPISLEAVKELGIQLLSNNVNMLEYFSPDFAKGILSRVNGATHH